MIPMNIHLVIATTGEYSDREIWIVQAFTDEAAAFAEAARLNAARPIIEELLEDYDKRRLFLEREEAKKCEPRQTVFSSKWGPTIVIQSGDDTHWYAISPGDRNRITDEITAHIGPRPEDPADDYTVVSIPIGEHGRWELP